MRLPAGVPADEIEARFRFLAHKHHPDHNDGSSEANENFLRLIEARNFLRANVYAGQSWSRTKEGLSWEWSRAPYRDNNRREEPRPAHKRAQTRIVPATPWETIRPNGEAPKAPRAARVYPFKAWVAARQSAARGAAVKGAAFGSFLHSRATNFSPLERKLAVAALIFWLAGGAIYLRPASDVKSVGDFGKKKTVESINSTPNAPKPAPARAEVSQKDLARDTIAKNWPLVVSCLSSIPKSRAYRGSVTYRVKIEKRLATEILIVNDTLGYQLAHSCVTRAIFAMDFARVNARTVVDFTGAFEIGSPRVARR